MARLLRIPDLGTADEEIRFLEWIVAPGAHFRAGEPLAVVETTKSAIDLEPLEEGVLLRRLAREGETLRRGAPYAVAGDGAETIDDAGVARLLAAQPRASTAAPRAPAAAPPAASAAAPPAAPAARARARELGLDLASILPSGPGGAITLADVERAAANAPPTAGSAADSGRPTEAAGVTDAGRARGEGRVDPAFLAHVRRDREAFGALDPAFKADLYRRHGALLGREVRIGGGAVLLARELRLGDEVTIAENVLVDCEVFEAGAGTHLGPRSTVRCREARLGENVYLVRDVEIGGGGHKDPWAEVRIGSHSFVGEEVHINVCRPVAIGEEAVISRRAVLMTHSFAQSALEGYPAVFAPLTIEAHTQIGIGAVIFPGVTIGEGTTVVSNASVVTSLPPGVLASGVPARPVRPARRPLDGAGRDALARRILDDFVALLRARGREATPCQVPAADAAWILGAAEERALLVYVAEGSGGDRGGAVERGGAGTREDAGDLGGLAKTPGGPFREIVVLRLRGELPAELPPGETHVALLARAIRGPLGPLASSAREFLRKWGIRLEPRTWTYRGGWI